MRPQLGSLPYTAAWWPLCQKIRLSLIERVLFSSTNMPLQVKMLQLNVQLLQLQPHYSHQSHWPAKWRWNLIINNIIKQNWAHIWNKCKMKTISSSIKIFLIMMHKERGGLILDVKGALAPSIVIATHSTNILNVKNKPQWGMLLPLHPKL